MRRWLAQRVAAGLRSVWQHVGGRGRASLPESVSWNQKINVKKNHVKQREELLSICFSSSRGTQMRVQEASRWDVQWRTQLCDPQEMLLSHPQTQSNQLKERGAPRLTQAEMSRNKLFLLTRKIIRAALLHPRHPDSLVPQSAALHFSHFLVGG